MANTIDWGKASVNNTNGYGKGAIDNTIRWGKIYESSASGETNIGTAAAPSFSNTLSTRFDGIDDVVDCGNNSSLQITGELSLSAWVKINSAASGTMTIISKDNLGARCFDLFAYSNSANATRFVIVNSNTFYGVNATTNIKDNSWHHVVGVFKPSTSLKIYVDGTLEGTNTTSIPASIDNDTVNVTLGSIISSGNNFFALNGGIDEVAVFNSELSASDVSSIYGSGVPSDLSTYSSLVSWWRMGDSDSFPTLSDNKGSNDGTMTNMTSGNIITDVPT